MNNKLNNMLEEFFKNNNVDNIDDASKKMQEFIKMYNNGEIKYENTPLDDAYEILEKAQNTKSKSEAVKLAKKAYEKSSECFDAILFQCDLEENGIKRMKLLDKGLEFEKNRLMKEKYFDKENIEHFYGIFETRPYIRGLVDKCNSNFVKYFNGTIKKSEKEISGYYSRGDASEIFMYLNCYDYLLITMPRLYEYVIENLMKSK